MNKKITKKQYDWNIRLTLIFGIVIGILFGSVGGIMIQQAMFFSGISLIASNFEGTNFEVNIDLVQTSCGFGVPLYDYEGERTQLATWGKKKSDEDLKDYWQEKNTISIDGYETGI